MLQESETRAHDYKDAYMRSGDQKKLKVVREAQRRPGLDLKKKEGTMTDSG